MKQKKKRNIFRLPWLKKSSDCRQCVPWFVIVFIVVDAVIVLQTIFGAQKEHSLSECIKSFQIHRKRGFKVKNKVKNVKTCVHFVFFVLITLISIYYSIVMKKV